MAGNPYTESGERFQIPDMLANRADTYNLGDILAGRDELFALSYLENALTSNPVARAARHARPRRRPAARAAGAGRGRCRPTSSSHAYSARRAASRSSRCCGKLLRVQQVRAGKSTRPYIASAAQDDAFRTEPPFKLQGSYRNMNKLAEKVVPVMNDAELEP